ncbi:hypothetical protein TNCV_4721081 [Trichonephila clavipes]|uniref:Uncharacterized protein n=1 Tax=Trichonephila clavipes TaxID=2585209 RepID=A0A8X7BEZ5_TRICX|nr:hypothetical protein TNCV_4721081 [Trichonephila clavipes]
MWWLGEAEPAQMSSSSSWFKMTRSVTKSPGVAEQCDVNIHQLRASGGLKTSLRQLQIFKHFLQLKEQASRTPNSLCEPRRSKSDTFEPLLQYNHSTKCFLSH